ncbi:hypothetical protein Tsubulata_015672 [Turnera subulata]|uniref:BRF2-like C-terminal domain-containing protein n=1 Tax=Turnera subulata TaxID=218843 RepID=A0A9Q0FUI9_9ROSI|nr:hypothetical protein Tsubulata_015672 [Turnera subulata]
MDIRSVEFNEESSNRITIHHLNPHGTKPVGVVVMVAALISCVLDFDYGYGSANRFSSPPPHKEPLAPKSQHKLGEPHLSNTMPCWPKCDKKSLITDEYDSTTLFCPACGSVQRVDAFQAETYTREGPQGVNIHFGSTGVGSSLPYKEKKIYEANNLIDDIAYRLSLSAERVAEVKSTVNEVTAGEFGDANSNWFPVLVGACVYVCMRRDNKCFSVAEVGDAVGCDVHELGRMVTRVVRHLGVELPEFDIVGVFERVVGTVANSRGVERETAERMRKQGVFLVQCAVKWFLTTGRRPVPVVVAVVVLVAEVNGVEGVKIEDLARDVHVAASTCRLRYKELLEVIVKVAELVLPWGKDVTLKNAVRNAPFVIRYMEMKSMARGRSGGEKDGVVENGGFNLEEVVSECLRKNVGYMDEEGSMESYDSLYFEMGEKRGVDEIDKLHLSQECLSVVYKKFLENGGARHLGESTKGRGRKRQRGDFELHVTEWWNGKSELSKKLVLKQILEKDVGLDTMPPSFVNGCLANESRKHKINAAKLRIDRIVHPRDADSGGGGGEVCVLDDARAQKRKRKSRVKDLDWEDFVIETLLLHQVKEEEIEKGHYNTLLSLHVFNSAVD